MLLSFVSLLACPIIIQDIVPKMQITMVIIELVKNSSVKNLLGSKSNGINDDITIIINITNMLKTASITFLSLYFLILLLISTIFYTCSITT